MRLYLAASLSLIAVLASTAVAPANSLYVYPKQGQSAEQQQRDQGECHVWAVQRSGFNPYGQSAGAAATGGVVSGAAGGAAVGAVGGLVVGKPGKGAAVGATTGALLGGIRQHGHNQTLNSMNQQLYAEYRRALRVCLEARGYAVS